MSMLRSRKLALTSIIGFQCLPVGPTAIFSEDMTLVQVLVMFSLGSIGKVCCRRGACQKLPSFRCRAIGHRRWLSRTTALRMARMDFGRL